MATTSAIINIMAITSAIILAIRSAKKTLAITSTKDKTNTKKMA